MSTFTPAPWRIVARGLKNDWDIEGANGEDMRGVLRGMFFHEADANLAGASPFLRDACQMALSALRGELSPAVAEFALEEALRKAGGEA